MSWREAQLSLQLEAELRAGFVARFQIEWARAREDAAWNAAASAIGAE